MTFEELLQWELFAAETPIDDLHTHHLPAAGIACLLANINRDTKRHPVPFKISDFLPPWVDLAEDVEPEGAEALRAKFEMVRDLTNQ